MKRYQFLFKPVFFIFSLLFATWLVLFIEKIGPSSLSEPGRLIIDTIQPNIIPNDRKLVLKKLVYDYRIGLIDSIAFDRQLTLFLKK